MANTEYPDLQSGSRPVRGGDGQTGAGRLGSGDSSIIDPSDSTRTALSAVFSGLRSLDGEESVEEPYIGFSAYSESRADFIGGRDDEILVISSNLRVSALTILYGPSGVGKSSTLCAGVIPKLKRVHEPADAADAPAVVYFKEWQQPDFESSLNQACVDAIDWGPEGVPTFPLGAQIDTIVRAAQDRDASVVFIFDQFEDYLSSTTPEGPAATLETGALPASSLRKHFDRIVARLVNRRDLFANLLIAIREDHLSKLDRFRTRIPHLLANTIRLDPLNAANAERAIRKPLETFNARAAEPERTEMGVEAEEPGAGGDRAGT